MKNVQKFIAYLVGALFAFFFPEVGTDGWVEALVSFTSFAPLVILVAAEINTWRKWEDTKAWLGTGVTAFGLAYLAYFLQLGIMKDVVWYYPAIHAIGAFAVAAWGFSIPVIKSILSVLYDYSYKKK